VLPPGEFNGVIMERLFWRLYDDSWIVSRNVAMATLRNIVAKSVIIIITFVQRHTRSFRGTVHSDCKLQIDIYAEYANIKHKKVCEAQQLYPPRNWTILREGQTHRQTRDEPKTVPVSARRLWVANYI